ncbi:MAG: hypothetical protein ACREMN_01885 [Gemmatimonadales bacterium]
MLTAVLLVFLALALLFLLAAIAAWRGRRWLRSLVPLLAAALFLSLAALCGAISVGIRGYRALTHEVVAATIRLEPIGAQRFRATVQLPDGRLQMFDLAGDAVYVDAHVLKWSPLANLIGLHTAYELDRIAGRYRALADEQGRERTVYSLAARKPFDLFDVARDSWLLQPLVDAQYGSATFVGAAQPATVEVRVSTTGLLVRPVETR